MAVSFKSAQKRAYWGALAFSLLCEYAVALVYFWALSRGDPAMWGWSIIAVIVFQILLSLYGLFSFARRAAWYHLFEKESRAATIAAEFARNNFPRPDGSYVDADEYLRQVALSPVTSPEGALFAGTLLGALEAHRLNGPRSEAFFLALSIERAIKLALPWEMAAERRSPQ